LFRGRSLKVEFNYLLSTIAIIDQPIMITDRALTSLIKNHTVPHSRPDILPYFLRLYFRHFNLLAFYDYFLLCPG